jgi:hypothetical protein
VRCPTSSPLPWPVDHRTPCPRTPCPRTPWPHVCGCPNPSRWARTLLPWLARHQVEAFRPSGQRQRWRLLLQARSTEPAHWPAPRPAARSVLLTSNSLSILLTMHACARAWRGQTLPGLLGTSGDPIGRLRARSIVEFCMLYARFDTGIRRDLLPPDPSLGIPVISSPTTGRTGWTGWWVNLTLSSLETRRRLVTSFPPISGRLSGNCIRPKAGMAPDGAVGTHGIGPSGPGETPGGTHLRSPKGLEPGD